MKYEPVRIKIKNKKKYCDIAFLVDRKDFLKEVTRLRQKWQITRLIKPKQEFEWASRMVKKGQYDSFWKDVAPIRNHFRLTANFDRAIYMAIISGYIDDKIYETAYWRPVDNDMDVGTPTRFAIYITADTTKKELEAAFREFKTQVKTIRKIRPFDRVYLSYGDAPPDTISNIKRDRKWYWKKKQEKTHLQIATEDKERGGIDPEKYKETVRKAVKQYEKRLQAS